MSRSFSLYLDLLRLGAALAVMISHLSNHTLLKAQYLPNSLGHNAVIVFFLLSGYVIAFVADHKENNSRAFWISRLARIYSVAIPAVLLAPLADQIGLALKPAFYDGGLTTYDHAAVRIAASLLFLNEFWLVSIMPFSNSPYWSLCYEMSYYLLYSIYCFAAGPRRNLFFAGAVLLIGPKILLLAPIWILGVVLYRHRPWHEIDEGAGWALWIGSMVGIAVFQWLDLGVLISEWTGNVIGAALYKLLHFSKHFLGDYLLALLFAANFVGFRRIAARFGRLLEGFEWPIRVSAGYTFSIYLFHLPLAYLVIILLDSQPRGWAYFLACFAITLAIIVLLGLVTEQQKDRLKAWLSASLPSYGPFSTPDAGQLGKEA